MFIVGGGANASVPLQLKLITHASVTPPQVVLSAESRQWLFKRQMLRVGVWKPAHPPLFMGFDPALYEGLTADYLGLVATTLNIRTETLLYNDREAALTALNSGEIDLLAFDDRPPGGNSQLIYSTPYLLDPSVLIANRSAGIVQKNRWINSSGVFIGDIPLKNILEKEYQNITFEQGFDYLSAAASVAYNNHEIMWVNGSTADYLMTQGYADLLEKVPDSDGPAINLSYAALGKNSVLIDAINIVLHNLPLASGQRIADTWGVDYSHVVKTLPLALSDEEKIWLSQHHEVKAIFFRGFAPLAFTDEIGRPRGLSVALLNMVAQRTGLKFSYEGVRTLDEMRSQLAESPVALLPVANSADLKSQSLLFTKPYFLSPWVMVAKIDFPTVKDSNALKGKRLAIYQDFSYIPELKKKFPQIEFVRTLFDMSTIEQLTSGDIDGILLPQSSARYLISNYFKDKFRIVYSFPAPTSRISMATTSNNQLLIDIINKTIAEIPPMTIQDLQQRWQTTGVGNRLNLWEDYQSLIVSVSACALVICAFFLWRTMLLKRVLRQRKQFEHQLQQQKERADHANESKSIFLAQMSHEIRTPLNALMGLLELEQHGKNTPQQRQHNLRVAWQASKSLSNLVGDVLDLAKIESGTLKIRHVPVSLIDKLQAVSALFTLTAAEKGLSLQTEHELQDPFIYSDPSVLKQIFSNLVSNAIKFTEEGSVEIALYQALERNGNLASYVLEVNDTGPGLTQEQQHTIFSPYIQADEIAHQQKGTGLGLTICRHLADLLGGSLTVESHPGEGASFIFRFQAEIAPSPETEIKPGSEIENIARHILIVDDHQANLLLLSQQLAWAGHKVIIAHNGAEAKEQWSRLRPDMVITDCHMPDMDGFSLTRAIRAAEIKEGLLPIPIIGLTAMAEQQIKQRAQAAGMTDCLFKPVDLGTLLSFVSGFEYNNDDAVISPDITSIAYDALQSMARHNPAAFQDLLATVMEQNQHDLQALKRHISARDYDAFYLSAHRLAGSASLIGHSGLFQLCREMEEASGLKNDILMSQLVHTVEQQVHELKRELETYQNGKV